MRRIVNLFFAILLSVSIANAQEVEDLINLSLEELMNVEISVSSKSKTTIRETAGIVTVITGEDIEHSGARDLLELLQLYVPGFNFGVDVEGVVGLGIRGLWAHEGKFLLMVDGQEFNDGMFATVPFGNHFTLGNVQKVEIIRGPGSSIYGGFAGIGVINIITREGKSTEGSASYLTSFTGKQFSFNNLSFNNTVVKDDFKLSFSGVYGNGARSEKDFIDTHGDWSELKGSSDIFTKQFGVKAKYRDFNLLALLDDYTYDQIDLWDAVYRGSPLRESFQSRFFQSTYDFKPSAKLTITPKVNYKWQQPWRLNVIDQGYKNSKIYTKTLGGITASLDDNKVKGIIGLEYSYEQLNQAPFIHDTIEEVFRNGKSHLSYTNIAAYGQVQLDAKYINLNVGARYDKSSEFGSAFVPRFALTKASENFHFKAMYSQSFRVPGGIIPNRQPVGYSIEPERGTIVEFEAGAKLPFQTYLTFNIFDSRFTKVIIYQTDLATGIGSYKNFGKIGSQGVEAEIKHSSKAFYANVNFAYYKRINSTTDSVYFVPGKDGYFLAFSPVRVNGSASYYISKNYILGASVSYFGERYGYVNTSGVPQKFDPFALVNLNFTVNRFLIDGMQLGLHVTNIFNTNYYFIQPYNGGHAPLPGLDRSIGFNVKYQF